MSGLFGKPESGEVLLIGRRDKDAAFAVLRKRAAVESYTGAIGYLLKDGQEAMELR